MEWDKAVALTVASLGTVATRLWGGVDEMIILLVTVMFLDYIMGIMCAYRTQELSSALGFQGIAKKVTVLIIVAVAVAVDSVVHADGAVRAMVILFYVGMDGVSILENAAVMGVKVPVKLKDALAQLHDGNKKDKGVKKDKRKGFDNNGRDNR